MRKSIKQIVFRMWVESQFLRKEINPEIRDSSQGQLRLVSDSLQSPNQNFSFFCLSA